jgi:Flp pilus assembly protein TadG
MRSKRLGGTGGGGQAGNATVELALVLPFLLLVIAGIVDLGMLYWEKHVLTNAAREGARAAARSGVGGAAGLRQSEVENIVYQYLYAFNLKKEDGNPLVTQVVKDVTYTLNAGSCNYTFPSSGPGTPLTVELANIPVKMMLLPNIQSLFGGGGGSVVNLSARNIMATEWSTPPAP